MQVIHHDIFYDDSFMFIIAKTGYGKSLIPLTITSIRRGIAVIKVSLLGLQYGLPISHLCFEVFNSHRS